jgi:hypothetical protein
MGDRGLNLCLNVLVSSRGTMAHLFYVQTTEHIINVLAHITNKQQVLVRMRGKRNPLTLLVGM